MGADQTALTDLLGVPALRADPRFATLTQRLACQDELDRLVDAATLTWDGYALMAALQAAGVPAGVCQTSEDRCEIDPQLRHLGWQVELPQSEIGIWPVKEVPVKFSETPPFIGGTLGRHGPSYGEDNDYVLRGLLGLGDTDISELKELGVL